MSTESSQNVSRGASTTRLAGPAGNCMCALQQCWNTATSVHHLCEHGQGIWLILLSCNPCRHGQSVGRPRPRLQKEEECMSTFQRLRTLLFGMLLH